MTNLTLESEILNNVLENKSINRQEIIDIYHNSKKNPNDLFLTAQNLRMKNNLMIHANFDRPNLYIKCVNVFNENLRRVGNKYCLNGALHVLDSKNKCKKCKINPKTYNYNDEEFNQLRNNKNRE